MTTQQLEGGLLSGVERQYERYLELAQLARISRRETVPTPKLSQPVGLVVHGGC